MFEFKWYVPGDPSVEVRLSVQSRRGWLARKVLTAGGRTIFQRGWLAGIEAEFMLPDGRRRLRVRIVRIPDSNDWRPALYVDGAELPEATGNPAPRVVPPPKLLVVPVGLTYLLMALLVVMLPQAGEILNALYARSDVRRLLLNVGQPEVSGDATLAPATGHAPASASEPGRPVITTTCLPPATLAQPYEALLQATGGRPPYIWRTVGRKGLPPRLTLDRRSGRICGTPQRTGHFPVTIRAVDDSYAPSRTIGRWVIPFAVTAACLLGFLSMRRWSVYAYGLLIVLQGVLAVVIALPTAGTALGLQAGLWLLGAAHLRKMC